MSGLACPGCVVEIYATPIDRAPVSEGSTVADGRGIFVLTTGSPFTGPRLMATATDPRSNTSPFSLPTLVGSLRLQEGNVTPGRRLVQRASTEIPDNRIGTTYPNFNDWFYDQMLATLPEEQLIHILQEIGIKRMHVLLDYGDFPDVDWSARVASTRLSPRQVSTITSTADAGIEVMVNLIFWDIDAQGQTRTPGYSRFKDDDEVLRYLQSAARPFGSCGNVD